MSLGCKTKITPTKRREGLKIAEKLALFGINHPEEQRMLKKPNYQTFPKQDASTSNSFSSERLTSKHRIKTRSGADECNNKKNAALEDSWSTEWGPT